MNGITEEIIPRASLSREELEFLNELEKLSIDFLTKGGYEDDKRREEKIKTNF